MPQTACAARVVGVTPDDDKVRIAGGSFVERLVCHSRLPLIAGLDSARPAVHVWELVPAGLRELAFIHADAAEYPAEIWMRQDFVPSMAWHPREPRLLVTRVP